MLDLQTFARLAWALFLLGMLASHTTAAEHALILDYELYPPEFSNAVIRQVAATGLEVEFREHYPVLTERDLAGSRMIVLEATAGQLGSGIE
ncbi:hypothetical protein ACYOEI_28365, partial [Singulisphaera rosea]